jgi:hypothetical protein
MNSEKLRDLLSKAPKAPWRTPCGDHDCEIDTPGDNTVVWIGKNGFPFAAAVVHSAFGQDSKVDAIARLIGVAPDLATEVLTLRAEMERLREALRVYADPCDATETTPCGYDGNMCCKTARAALRTKGGE